MIVGKDLTKDFDGLKALDHLNFHVKKGTVYGLVGPNGAGKSTLLRHIVGIFQQDEGEILVDGMPVYENVAIKQKMAFIPDDIFCFKSDSIKDMKLYYQGIFPSFDEELYQAMLTCFPEIDEKKQIRRMSKGMQKQVAFLLSICVHPQILVLDEPVDGLDPVMRRQIWSILLDHVAKEEMTVLVSSHNLRELEDVCDHVGIMNHGKILVEQSLHELQGNIVKVQVAYADTDTEPEVGAAGVVLKHTSRGKIHDLIVRGKKEEIEQALQNEKMLLLDFLPLSLEEIFIYELGGEDYAVKDIIME